MFPMSELEVILEYKGVVSFETIDELLLKLKAKPAFTELRTLIRKRAYYIIVECLENIYKHTYPDLSEEEKVLPYFYFGRQENNYVVSVGNLVSNNGISQLKYELEQINQLDRNGLKALYEEIINKQTISNVNGAGLGLVTIALRAKNKISYTISAVDDKYSFVEMMIIVSPTSNPFP